MFWSRARGYRSDILGVGYRDNPKVRFGLNFFLSYGCLSFSNNLPSVQIVILLLPVSLLHFFPPLLEQTTGQLFAGMRSGGIREVQRRGFSNRRFTVKKERREIGKCSVTARVLKLTSCQSISLGSAYRLFGKNSLQLLMLSDLIFSTLGVKFSDELLGSWMKAD